MFCYFCRGHKRKHDDAKEEEEDVDDDMEDKEERGDSADESSKESNEEEEGSSSEADEMAAALEAELNDFMWCGKWGDSFIGKGQQKKPPSLKVVPKILFFSTLESVCT